MHIEIGSIALITKPICVLNPVLSVRCIHCCRIAGDIVKLHISAVHDIEGPKLRVLHVEIVNVDVRDVPEDEGHRSSGLSVTRFCGIPDIAVAIDTSSAVSIDGDVASGDHEARSMVLESNRVKVIAPVI